jgi:hypothetical protein
MSASTGQNRVTNQDIKAMLEERWLIADRNERRLDGLEPRVSAAEHTLHNHEVLLNGDPKNIADKGITGMVVDINEFLDSIKMWFQRLAIPVILWAILGGLDKLVDLIHTVETLTK